MRSDLFANPGFGAVEPKIDISKVLINKSHITLISAVWILNFHTFLGELEISMIKEKD